MAKAKFKRKEYPPCEADQELEYLIRAKYGVLYVVSWEEKRVISSLSAICEKDGINLSGVEVWDSARGLITPKGDVVNGGEVLVSPESILDHISQKAAESISSGGLKKAKIAKGPIFVLCDMFRYLSPMGMTPELERKIRSLANILRKTTIHVVIVSPELELPSALSKSIAVIDYPLPAKDQLSVLFSNVKGRLLQRKRIKEDQANATPDENVIRALMGLTIEEAEDALALAIIQTEKFDVPTILSLKRQIIRKGELLDFVWPEEGMEDVGGLHGVKEYIHLRKGTFGEKAREYGLPFPKGVFLLGVQGAGKSLCAKAIAKEMELPLLKLDAGKLFGELMGQSEKQARHALHLAESIAPCVLFIDELDKALAGGEGASTDSGTTKRVIALIQNWMMEKTAPVFVIGCANSTVGLPPAMLRKGRFDEMFFVDLPNAEERISIFRIHISKRGRDPEKFDLDALAKDQVSKEFSGAEIEAVVVDAMSAAFSDEGREFNTDDILRSIRSTTPLAVTAKETVDAIRDFAHGRMKMAGAAYYKDDAEEGEETDRFGDDGI
jgi:ATP-dependent 26S proteasome regulatory subunit